MKKVWKTVMASYRYTNGELDTFLYDIDDVVLVGFYFELNAMFLNEKHLPKTRLRISSKTFKKPIEMIGENVAEIDSILLYLIDDEVEYIETKFLYRKDTLNTPEEIIILHDELTKAIGDVFMEGLEKKTIIKGE